MQVSISKAAKMAGITRATFYRHVEKKGISITKDGDDNPKVDVSELIRVYGDKIKINKESEELNNPNTPRIKQSIHNNTPLKIQIEIEVLKERIANLEVEKQQIDKERLREREQLSEQIELLKEHLSSSQEQQKRLTLLITDQRKKEEGRAANETDLKLQELSQLLEAQIQERQSQEEKLKTLERRISDLKEKGNFKLKNMSDKNKKLVKENRLLKEEVNKGFWKKLFS